MNKTELLQWLQEEYKAWQALMDEIGPARMEQPGVAAHWSVKDIVAHLNGWQPKLIGRLQAAHRGEPAPPLPWPTHLQTDDEINGWIYDANRERPLADVLAESEKLFQQLITVIDELPDDVRIEQVHHQESVYNLIWIGEERFVVGEFFDHFHDDHEPDIRAWLAGLEN